MAPATSQQNNVARFARVWGPFLGQHRSKMAPAPWPNEHAAQFTRFLGPFRAQTAPQTRKMDMLLTLEGFWGHLGPGEPESRQAEERLAVRDKCGHSASSDHERRMQQRQQFGKDPRHLERLLALPHLQGGGQRQAGRDPF